MKTRFKYQAHTTSQPSIHVHCDRVKEGEIYVISKTDDPRFVSVTGNLYDKNMGMERANEKHVLFDKLKPYLRLVGIIPSPVGTCYKD